MKIPLTIVFMLVLASLHAQLAKDYICRDASKKQVYEDKKGNIQTFNFERSFVHKKKDTVYVYTRSIMDYLDSLIIIANGNKLIIAQYVFYGEVNEDDSHADTIVIVKGDEKIVTNRTVYSDMSEYSFEITTTYLSSYKLPNGLEFKDVIKYDQFNKKRDYHYITYIAKGQGIIDQGDGEHRLKK